MTEDASIHGRLDLWEARSDHAECRSVCAATASVTIGHLDISSRVFLGHRVSFFWTPLVRHRGRGVALTPGGFPGVRPPVEFRWTACE